MKKRAHKRLTQLMASRNCKYASNCIILSIKTTSGDHIENHSRPDSWKLMIETIKNEQVLKNMQNVYKEIKVTTLHKPNLFDYLFAKTIKILEKSMQNFTKKLENWIEAKYWKGGPSTFLARCSSKSCSAWILARFDIRYSFLPLF